MAAEALSQTGIFFEVQSVEKSLSANHATTPSGMLLGRWTPNNFAIEVHIANL